MSTKPTLFLTAVTLAFAAGARAQKKFDLMKDKSGMMTTADATKYFARGNLHRDSE
jgi:hypothetical protein